MGISTETTTTNKTGPSTTQPLAKKVRLAGNPIGQPKYSRSVRLKSGDTIAVACPSATRGLVALMDMQAVLGGAASHFGGPSAFAELMSALHGLVFEEAKRAKKLWHEMFHLLNDAGHCENGLYALKANYGFSGLSIDALKGFRSIQSHLTGHGEAHIYPEGVYLSNGPLGSCFPQSQGLCYADRLAGVDRVTVTAISDGAVMEGEAREALAAIPGLAVGGKLNPYVLIVSDNNTKLSGRIDKDAYSLAPTFESLAILGWDVIRLEDGHDLQKCVSAMEEALSRARSNPKRPVAIHARTIKGYGVAKLEQSSSGGHGFPLSDPKDLAAFLTEIYKGEQIPTEFMEWANRLVADVEAKKKNSADQGRISSAGEKIQNGISRAMIKMKKAGHPVFSISSDLAGSTGVSGFQKEFPWATQDVGVAEANMISMAAGLGKQGFIPVVDTFAQFGVTKGALPLIMSSLSQAPVICVFSHTGFQDAADGASHQALSYLAMTCSIPYTDVYCLTSSAEAEDLMTQTIENYAKAVEAGKTPHSTIFFLGRENFPVTLFPEGHRHELQAAQVVFDNTNQFSGGATIVAGGSLLPQAIEAAYELEKEKIGCVVVNPSIMNRPDVDTLRGCLRNTGGNLVTVEDHQITGGMGAMICHALSLVGVNFQLKSLGVAGHFGQSAYKASELYSKHKMDRTAIAATVKAMGN